MRITEQKFLNRPFSKKGREYVENICHLLYNRSKRSQFVFKIEFIINKKIGVIK